MTKQDRKALAEYVRSVANEMELRDWTIEVLAEPCADGNVAYVTCTFGRKQAQVSFAHDFRDRAPEEQRDTVVHELVHLHLESATSMVRNDLEPWLGKQADAMFFDGYRRQIEYGVDALAAAVAKHLPVIAWPE